MLYLAAALVACGALGVSPEVAERDLWDLSLEELGNVEVTSVSKSEERRAGAAAAVAVISGEEIRRSGATSVADALRMAPGIDVGRVTSSTWAVSSRGFGSVNSPKLLVLTDTRSIYTPLFSGVFWDVQDLLLEDVDRIEVIRGPGASLWGSNAVNGVINISTKNAKDTHGLYFEGGGGTYERGFGALRYGGQIGEGFHYRVFGKYFDRTGGFNPAGPANDNWWLGHWGFRADWQISQKDVLTFQGDGYDGKAGQVKPAVTITGRTGPAGKLAVGLAGGNGLARWSHAIGPESEFHLRVYYDRSYRNDPTFVDRLDTIDLDFQHRLPLPLNQDVLWGVNYRLMANQNEGRGVFEVRPSDSRDNLFGGFVQDRISILKSLRLTLGTKLEHNDFSGFEIQPSGRLAWDPFTGHTVWLAVSRAVRVPTRLERDLFITISESARTAVRLLGNKAFTSEKLWAYEIGYRWEAAKELFIDLAGFYNHYRGLASLEYGATFIDPQDGRTNVPLIYQNSMGGVGKGIEAAVTFTPVRFWRLTASYSNLVLTLDPRGQDLTNLKLLQGASPRHKVGLQSFLDLPAHFRLDGFFRYVGPLRGSPEGAAGQEIPGYASLDLRVAWQAWKSVEISLVGQNLLQDHHPEFFGGTEVQRGVYGKLAGVF